MLNLRMPKIESAEKAASQCMSQGQRLKINGRLK